MMLLAIATVEAYMLPSSSAPVFVSRPAVRSAAVAMEVEAPKKGLGFVNGEMRAAAMKLHTRDQAPKEGQQPAQKPVSVWAPGRADYLRFLVDSREVYRCMDDLVATTPAYAPFRNSGLERVAALDADIAWFAAEGEPTPAVGKPGADYVEVLRGIETGSPAFVCHFYNQYFAHTAGGLMIGKKMSDALLDGRTLEFYKWGDAGDVNPKEVCRAAPRRAAHRPPAAAARLPPPRPQRAHPALPPLSRRSCCRRCAPRSTRWRRGGRGRRKTRASTKPPTRSGTAAASSATSATRTPGSDDASRGKFGGERALV